MGQLTGDETNPIRTLLLALQHLIRLSPYPSGNGESCSLTSQPRLLQRRPQIVLGRFPHPSRSSLRDDDPGSAYLQLVSMGSSGDTSAMPKLMRARDGSLSHSGFELSHAMETRWPASAGSAPGLPLAGPGGACAWVPHRMPVRHASKRDGRYQAAAAHVIGCLGRWMDLCWQHSIAMPAHTLQMCCSMWRCQPRGVRRQAVIETSWRWNHGSRRSMTGTPERDERGTRRTVSQPRNPCEQTLLNHTRACSFLHRYAICGFNRAA